jgi:tRNA (adenine57-N1/adenine58-N1)-methyltransferase
VSSDEKNSASTNGLFAVGDRAQLTDAKGKLHTITLALGAQWHTHKGWIEHDELIGQPEGIVVKTTQGVPYLALKPLYADYVLSMPRGATIVYPKDSAQIVGLADIYPGARVIEAGVGSGALTIALLRAVGNHGSVRSFEKRPEFGEIATTNISSFFGALPANWSLSLGALQDCLDETGVDRIVLDMLAPWECIEAAAAALRPGGVIIAYVATTTQLSRTAEALKASELFTEPIAWESMVRGWHLEGLAVRPEHRMIGHTGFLIQARRMAPGHPAPVRRRRPAKGSYGTPLTED